MLARSKQLAVRPVLGLFAHGTIGPVRLAPQRALPVARLPQQVIPFDLLVVWRVEQIDVRRHVVAHVVVYVANQAPLPRQPDHRRQKRLRDAVGDLGALRIAPLGDDVTVARDESARSTAILDRSDDRVVRLLAEAVVKKQRHVPGTGRLGRDRQLHGLVHERRVHADLFGLLVLPVEAFGEVDRLRRLLRGDGPLRESRRDPRELRESGRDDTGGEDDWERASQHRLSPCEAAV